MCTTRRYLYLCCHPATNRFRNTACDNHSGRGCRPRDFNVYLAYPCRECCKNGMQSVDTGVDKTDFVFSDTWYIPSRCFIDSGFRTLDPFQDEPMSSLPSTPVITSVVDPPSRPGSCIAPPETTPPFTPFWLKDELSLYRKLFRRVTKRKQALSTCCAREKRNGPVQRTRLEGRDFRRAGKIVENRCEAPF